MTVKFNIIKKSYPDRNNIIDVYYRIVYDVRIE